MRELWQELHQELAALVLPAACAGCGLARVRGELCGECEEAFRSADPRRVWPSQLLSGLPRVYAAMPYADEVRAVLLAHKERGALRLVSPLGELLAAAVLKACARSRAASGAGLLSLVPVPSARRAVAGRGHDPVRRIALAAAGRLRREGLPARVVAALRQRRAVADQAGLSARQRSANLSGALELVPGSERLLAAGETVLVDDLITTGASLAEAARTVREQARSVIAAAVVAYRPRA